MSVSKPIKNIEKEYRLLVQQRDKRIKLQSLSYLILYISFSVIKIDGAQSSVFIPTRANGLNDPRDVAIGPAPTAGAGGAVSGAIGGAELTYNKEPEFDVYLPDGTNTYLIEMAHSTDTQGITTNTATLSLAINGTDAEGDTIRYTLSEQPDFIQLASSANGTTTLEIDITDVPADIYLFRITASDAHNNESYDYALIISES